MNIIEAIKSGRRYKRKSQTYWYTSICNIAPGAYLSYTLTELQADDWEVEEEKIEITREMVLDVINYLGADDNIDSFSVFDELKKRANKLKETGE